MPQRNCSHPDDRNVQNSELVGIYERKKTNPKNTHTPHATLQYSVIYDFNNCPIYFLFENDAFFLFPSADLELHISIVLL